jgi:hypothetical protein
MVVRHRLCEFNLPSLLCPDRKVATIGAEHFNRIPDILPRWVVSWDSQLAGIKCV